MTNKEDKKLDFDLDFLDEESPAGQQPDGSKQPRERTPSDSNNERNWKSGLGLGIFILGFMFFAVLASYSGGSSPEPTTNSRTNEIPRQTDSNEAPRTYNSLPNGTVIYSSPYYLRGNGELEIDNGNDSDVLVKLVGAYSGTPVYSVYIKSNRKYNITGISDGNYRVIFMHGEDWDTINKTFLFDVSYSEFGDILPYTTTEETRYDGIYEIYSGWEITLYPVYGGDVDIENISKSEFEKY